MRMVEEFIKDNDYINERYDGKWFAFMISPCNLNRQGEEKSDKDNSAKGLPEEELNKLRMQGEEVTEKTMALKDAENYGKRYDD